MRTPTEQLADETERLNDLLSAGAINAETFGRAMANAQEDIKGSAVDADLEAFFSEIDRKSDELAKKTTTDWDNAFAGWANSYSSTLNDMLWGSETTFEGIATSFGKMITEMIIQQELIKPFVSGATGDDGWISQGFGAITNWIASEHGNVFASNQCGISAYSNQIVSSPTVFPFASGIGLMGEAGAEAIFPLTRMPTGNLGVEAKLNGGSSINVVNNITVESSGNADDDQELARNIATQIDVAVRRIIADEKRHGGLIA
jgi:lambda family phage tail tape measure protein